MIDIDDPTAYRQLLSRFPTGVAVATTTDADGRPIGMTASAISSVSLSPPLLLICVSKAADFHGALTRAGGFALSVLAHDQEALSRRFAETRPDRFDGVPISTGPDGLPLLAGAAAHIICRKWGAHEVGDHTIFFGLVAGGTVFERRPLIHHRSGYTTVTG